MLAPLATKLQQPSWILISKFKCCNTEFKLQILQTLLKHEKFINLQLTSLFPSATSPISRSLQHFLLGNCCCFLRSHRLGFLILVLLEHYCFLFLFSSFLLLIQFPSTKISQKMCHIEEALELPCWI